MSTPAAARDRLSRAERYALGKSLRDKVPRESHAACPARGDRLEPLRLLEESSQGRIPELIPIRYGRMLQTPFTFYRGAALNMAADLARTPASGLRVQACGDCHLSNFGAFATPERRVVFDINDLGETLPAPWEWDVKRPAASFGWTEGQQGRHFYVRQLKDMKINPLVEVFTPSVMRQYGELCGWTLARAHARSGEPAQISGYLGKSDVFDEAIAAFSVAYADPTERDHDTMVQAVREGDLEGCVEGP